MQEIFIRDYGNGNFSYFMSKQEYEKRLNKEFLELKKIDKDVEIDSIETELVGIIEFDNASCLTVEGAINELFKNDESDLLEREDKYKDISANILEKNYLTYKVKGSYSDYFKISFNMISLDEEDLLESKITNVKLEII